MCSIEGPPLKDPVPQPLTDDQPYPIYLDHNATTPLCDAAWNAMSEARTAWGNPSSSHRYGSDGKYFLEKARRKVLQALGADSNPYVICYFTSGGTEANNLGIVGTALTSRSKDERRDTIISSIFEHPATDQTLQILEKVHHFRILHIPVDQKTGMIVDPHVFCSQNREKIVGRVAVATLIHVNNELGTIQPVQSFANALRAIDDGIIVHVDAAQSIGKIPVSLSDMPDVQLLSVCSHKFYGPKGVGALLSMPTTSIIRELQNETVPLRPILFGADSQENGIRPGTEAVMQVAGMASALEEATVRFQTHVTQAAEACYILYTELKRHAKRAGFEIQRSVKLVSEEELDTIEDYSTLICYGLLPNTINFALFHSKSQTYVSAPRMIASLASRVAMSAGAACHSAQDELNPEISKSLLALGFGPLRALATLRLSTGRLSTHDDMRRAARWLVQCASNQIPPEY